ncbi:hypothetical protein FHG66_05490 [Rubellimicrobium rubrum]|uniref:Uncharacterized protein n=1 Tax=Rubellimicrobium rubrum TaxID=2585369 RepID=A0A5C4N0I8_9RHOB|nr:hypothetical protein [Rubellimicrobium rubrum]TNC51612.1 hypothetical protein FHG66_05490 [Rubellimicrobium rubrum]
MPDLDLDTVASVRRQADAVQDDLQQTRMALAIARLRAAEAKAIGDTATVAAAAQEAEALDQRRATLIASLRESSASVRAASEALLAAVTAEQAVASLSGRHPVLLLPVRIETRFFDGGDTLKVRIFPDQIHVTAHDPALTDTEVAGLSWYWAHRWPSPDAGTEAGLALAEQAWQGLTQRLSPGRAAFVVRTYPPDNLGSGEPGPAWGNLPRRAVDAMTPARATLLPDRWCVIGYRADGEGRHTEIFRRWGAAVPDRLAAGPSADLGPAATSRGLPDDPELLWLRDPDEAERLGMMVTVRQADLRAGAVLREGVDRLVVVGVDWTLGPEAAGAAVEAHLRAHANEGRLGFVPQGAPTNSNGLARSGFTTDPAVAQRVLAPHRPPAAAPDAAGPVTAKTLGLGDGALSRVPGAHLREQGWQAALLDATWSAIGGYYLTEMLDPIADGPAIETSLRRHVVDHLRASGPVPTLRVGAQPYGMLPVMPRDRFEPDIRRRAQADVAQVAAALRRLAEPLVAKVPRLSHVRGRGDVDDVLLALLQRMPVAWSLTFRKLIGPVERKAVSVDWDRIAAFQGNVTAILLAQLGCQGIPHLYELTHDNRDHPLDVPLVLKPDPTPEDATRRSTEYLGEIRSLLVEANGTDILDARQNSIALLEAFIACAASHENRKAGGKLVEGAAGGLDLSPAFTEFLRHPSGRIPYTLRIEATAVAPAAASATMGVPLTPREFGQMIIPAVTGERTITQHVATQFLERLRRPGSLDAPDDPLHWLSRFDAALAALETAPADELEWAFRGVLDLYSTRLDAWITSLATARLAEHRTAAPAGLHIGGWGVVEDLRPDLGRVPESLGFVHAPSLGQAASAAVMRSARLSHRDAEGRLFDIDLTSRRVREGLRILEGVAAGQRLAALLGYRIERGLQERDLALAQWILPLRQQCPLRSERPNDTPATEPLESVAARDVVDGLALLARWGAERDGLLVAAEIPSGPARDGTAAVLDDVAGLADAVSDLLMSEAVHQATMGNLERSGAALAAHDRQERAPDPDFVRTPRSGPVLTHRAGLWLPRDAAGPAPGWPADLRSLAEPRLDRWLGRILGDPSRWTVEAALVRPLDPQSEGVPADAEPERVTLPSLAIRDLGLSALSVVLAARRPGAAQPSELEARLALLFTRAATQDGLALDGNVRIDLAADSLAPLLDLASWAGEVVGSAPLAPEHLAAADDLGRMPSPAAAPDIAEATSRAQAVIEQVSGLADAAEGSLSAWIASPDDHHLGPLLDGLLALAEVEGPEALPAGEAEGLADHAAHILARVRSRLAAAHNLPLPAMPAQVPGEPAPPSIGEPAELVRARGIVRLLLGNGQPFLPVLAPALPERLAAPVAARDGLLGGDGTAVAAWVHRSALVRPLLDPLAALLVHAEADGAPVSEDLAVIQLPHDPQGRWIALPFGAAGPPPEGTMGLVLHAPDGFAPANGGAGLIVDSWTETVPTASETTAVTFHYDAPGARPPQAMLLAVHPALSPDRWDFDTLVGSVNEAVDLARLRTLGSRELAGLSTLVPAIFLPDVYSRDVPSLRFFDLAKNAKLAAVGGLIGDHVLGQAEVRNG